ncbi:efflux RND transporter periplasmic adaptor subunit [Flavobacterium columnare]|uniref:HlyD family efflux transporter periplasmic adaptor subunit n=1 Tax=Flavobacterium columnare TaxID=996 RepID=A0AAI8GAN9_9FLAO|nr:efflux RND transporter periplasmic adaptor subunit [Flavobacterium columnare]AMO19913.1 HlyD family efflux transporter periplasmic adaptor subunit [Flavobacterium columnare]AUX17853.1 secretion protein HlyD [Flavobacterium columnare]MEB3800724.1 efflux RND transporter periplasmic adaptor subunit [Flavobacterium columnare]QOG56920.1 efflux RND transporter periplasmic adaptor subunit [Flavobacterium columnare]QOG59644.1 efflux RND transporter periplasmic adaptor subunit [Flavobacterium column
MKKILLISLLSIVSCSKKAAKETQPKKGTVTESVYASGVVKADKQYIVFSTVTGVLQNINVKPGQPIIKGQSLFQIESEKANLATENARLSYEITQENGRYIRDKIAEAELRIQSAKDKLILDESLYKRSKNVKEYNAISEVDFEKVELAYKNSKLVHEMAIKQLSQLKTQLRNEQDRSNVNLRINQKTQSDFIVKSAFSGELYDILVKEGTVINQQTPLAIIGKKDNYILELDIDENDMVRVQVGQKIGVTMDSYKGEFFQATVAKIYPIMDVRSRTFKIEAHFVKPPQKLYPNLTAEANIIIQTRKNILTIPRNYLIEEQYVLVNENEKRKIKTGLKDYQKVEVISGLKVDETIYMPK